MNSAIAILVASTASFAVAVLATPAVTRLLKALKLGKQIRDEASAPIMAKLHAGKSGTPTMGGILIWGSGLAVAFLFSLAANVVRDQPWIDLNFISRRETLLPI